MRLPVLLTLILTLFSLVSQASAPLCQKVFVASNSTAVQPLIAQLADLKLQIDLLQSEGKSNNIALRSLKNSYPVLLSKIIKAGPYSEEQVVTLVREEIRRLQNRKDEEQKIESRQRQETNEVVLRPEYVLDRENIKAPDWTGNIGDNPFYDPASKKILSHSGTSLRIGVLDSTTHINIPAEAIVQVPGKLEVFVKRVSHLMIVTKDFKTIGSYEIDFVSQNSMNSEMHSLELNRDSSLMLMKGFDYSDKRNILSVVELGTYKEVLYEDKMKFDDATDATFLDKDHLAVVSNRELRVIEVATGDVTFSRELDLSASTPNEMQVVMSPDKKRLVIFSNEQFLSLDVHNLAADGLLSHQPTTAGTNNSKPRLVRPATGLDRHLIESDMTSGAKLVNANTLVPEFKFQDKYSGKENHVFAFIPSTDGEVLLALYYPDIANKKDIRMDIWKKR